MKKLKKIKKTKKIFIFFISSVLFVSIIMMGYLVYKNRDTLLPMYYVITNQTDILEQKKLDTDRRALEAIKEFGIENVRPLTDDETEMLNSGEITEEEAVNIVLGRTDENTQSDEDAQSDGSTSSGESSSLSGNNNKPGGNLQSNGAKPSNPKPEQDTGIPDEAKAKNEEIAQLIGRMYVLKAKFTSDLADVEKWVNDQYWIYTLEYGEGNVPSSIKTKIGKRAYEKATALEVECDTEVNNILSRITTLLTETGQSTKVVDEIKAAYENEKMLAKSYYMDQI